jgi:hypothetical protein
VPVCASNCCANSAMPGLQGGRSRNQAKLQAIGEAVQSISGQFRDVQPVRSPSVCNTVGSAHLRSFEPS